MRGVAEPALTGVQAWMRMRAMLFRPLALLYYLCFLLLTGLTVFIACKASRRTSTPLRRTFFLLALSLLLWQLTLFLEVRTVHPAAQLRLGRANFAAVVFAAYFALRFVQEVPAKGAVPGSTWSRWLFVATVLLALVTLLTPLISAAERVEAGRAVTTFGPLFPVYLIHVVGGLAAALVMAFCQWRKAEERRVRGQVLLIGSGMLLTGGVALVTNALLPYGRGDFRFCDVGTLSTLFFVLAVAYATFVHRLFDLRVIVRETLVYGMLLAFVLGAYSSTVFVLSQALTEGAEKLVQFAVLLIAFSFDPLRRFLEEKTDRLLFGDREDHGAGGRGRGSRKRRRLGSRLTLALLFPWRRP
jgi:hypothetical protein